MIDAVSVVCPEVKSKVEAISLSRRTIVRCIDAIVVNIQEQLLTASGSFQWLSIALDESTDIQDTAHLLIYLKLTKTLRLQRNCYLWGLSKTLLLEKMVYSSVINSLIRSGLSLDKLASITTDVTPSLTGKHSGIVNLMNDKIKEDFPLHNALSCHYIIHQERLCKSSLKLKHVMDPVMRAVNSIRARRLKHKQFRSFLEDIEADFTDVLYHTNVYWLSKHGKSTKEGVGPQSRDCHVFQYKRHLL